MALHSKVTEKDFQGITNFFYKSGNADKALSLMRYFFDDAPFAHILENGKNGPLPYYFYRIAQIHPQLRAKYEELIAVSVCL